MIQLLTPNGCCYVINNDVVGISEESHSGMDAPATRKVYLRGGHAIIILDDPGNMKKLLG